MNKKLPAIRVPTGDVFPNSWNPNLMPADKYEKLKNWLEDLHRRKKALPPIIVRPHPKQPGKYQIIDGEHRWKAQGELGFSHLSVFVMDVDTKTAMLLTNSFNDIHGEKNEEQHIKNLHRLHTKFQVPMEELTNRLAENRSELIDKLALANTDEAVDLLAALHKEQIARNQKITEEDGEEKEAWVKMEFQVPLSASKLIEAEIDRIENKLSGAQRRGRALEMMAVQSSQGEVMVPEGQERKRKKREKVA